MARARSPNRDKAFGLYKESGGTKLLVDIAAELGVSDSQIRKWKSQDKWDKQMNGNVTIPISNVTNIERQVKVTPLVQVLKQMYEKKEFTDKTWIEKEEKGTLTLSELTWLNTIILSRKSA